MAADALVTLEAGASAGMVLTPKAGIFRLQHQKSYHIKAKQKSKIFAIWQSTSPFSCKNIVAV